MTREDILQNLGAGWVDESPSDPGLPGIWRHPAGVQVQQTPEGYFKATLTLNLSPQKSSKKPRASLRDLASHVEYRALAEALMVVDMAFPAAAVSRRIRDAKLREEGYSRR